MRGRTVLILLVLVAGLVAFIELYEHELPSSEERSAVGKLVLPLDPLEITGIGIDRDGSQVRLERLEAGDEIEPDLEVFSWHLVEPMSARADRSLVVALIEGLTNMEKRRTLGDGNRAELGLDPPRLAVEVITPQGRSTVLVGSDVPAGNSMIISSSATGEIHVVDNRVWPELSREAGDWRDRQVFDVGQEVFQRVVLSSSQQQTVLVRRDGEFWLQEPIEDRADGGRVGDLLTALASMQVVSFLDGPEEGAFELGLDPPRETLAITLAAGEVPVRLAWGGAVPEQEGQNFASMDGQVFSTSTDLAPFFDASVESWRSPDLTTLETFQIDELQIEQEGFEPLALAREGANWRRNGEEISFPSVSALLYSITDARAAAIEPRAADHAPAMGDSQPRLRVMVRSASRVQTMDFFSPIERGVPVTVAGREVVLFVEQDEFTEILANVGLVRAANGVKTELNEQLPSTDPSLSSDQ